MIPELQTGRPAGGAISQPVLTTDEDEPSMATATSYTNGMAGLSHTPLPQDRSANPLKEIFLFIVRRPFSVGGITLLLTVMTVLWQMGAGVFSYDKRIALLESEDGTSRSHVSDLKQQVISLERKVDAGFDRMNTAFMGLNTTIINLASSGRIGTPGPAPYAPPQAFVPAVIPPGSAITTPPVAPLKPAKHPRKTAAAKAATPPPLKFPWQ